MDFEINYCMGISFSFHGIETWRQQTSEKTNDDLLMPLMNDDMINLRRCGEKSKELATNHLSVSELVRMISWAYK